MDKIKDKNKGVAENAVSPLKNSIIGPLLKTGNLLSPLALGSLSYKTKS